MRTGRTYLPVLLLVLVVLWLSQEAKFKAKSYLVTLLLGLTETGSKVVLSLLEVREPRTRKLLGVLAVLLRLLRMTARVTKGTGGKQLSGFPKSSGLGFSTIGE